MKGTDVATAMESVAAIMRLRDDVRPEEAVGALALALGVGSSTGLSAGLVRAGPAKSGAERMRELRRREAKARDDLERHLASLRDAERDGRDGESDGGDAGGLSGGPTQEDGGKLGKERGSESRHLPGQEGNADDGVTIRDETPSRSASRPASQPSRGTEEERAIVKVVFEAWQKDTGHDRTILDRKRGARILARLREGFTVERLIAAIQHRKNDPFLMGHNDTGRVYDGIETLLRDASQVERLERLVAPMRPAVVNGSRNASVSLLARAQRLSDEERRPVVEATGEGS